MFKFQLNIQSSMLVAYLVGKGSKESSWLVMLESWVVLLSELEHAIRDIFEPVSKDMLTYDCKALDNMEW